MLSIMRNKIEKKKLLFFNTIKMTTNNDNYNTLDELIEHYYKNYPDKHYFDYPEFTVNKLKLDNNLLKDLSPKNNRTREEIRDWMKKLDLTFSDWIYVGW